MRSTRLIVLAAALTLLSACATTTTGRGSPPSQRTSQTHSPDFPPSSAVKGGGITSPGAPMSPNPSDATTTATRAAATAIIAPPASPLRTARVQGTDGVTYEVDVWVQKQDASCADHAYGTPVITYLTEHPCAGLRRLLATTTVDGRGAGMAISDLGFTGHYPQVYTTAGEFTKLVTKNGTGNIDDLLRDGYRLPSGPTAVPSPDSFSALSQDAGVEVVDAWYLAGPTAENDPKLVAMEQALFLQLG